MEFRGKISSLELGAKTTVSLLTGKKCDERLRPRFSPLSYANPSFRSCSDIYFPMRAHEPFEIGWKACSAGIVALMV